MNIEEYADALNLELEIRRYPNQGGRYVASLENCEIKDGPESCCLTSAYGNGLSPTGAIKDYLTKIRGKLLVVNAMGGAKRREYIVPMELSV